MVESPAANKLMAKSLSDDRKAPAIINQNTRLIKPDCMGGMRMQNSAAVPRVMNQAEWAKFSLQERSKLN